MTKFEMFLLLSIQHITATSDVSEFTSVYSEYS